MERIIEICCGSYEDALNAYHGGAKRIELNNALHLGGLTPSLATLKLTKKNTNLKVITMVRPRGAGFCYNEIEFEVMKEDAKICIKQTKEMIEIIKSYQGEVVFHRAFDCVEDPYTSIELLIELGVDRILTSGLKPKAIDGNDLIKNLQEKYGSQIEILAGSGVNYNNASSLMEHTGISQVHSSCKDYEEDPTTSGKSVTYSYYTGTHANDYESVDQENVEKLVSSLQNK